MSKVTDCARALGEAIVASEEYKNMQITESAAMSEWTVRPNFKSPQKPIVQLSSRPFSREMVSRSVSV